MCVCGVYTLTQEVANSLSEWVSANIGNPCTSYIEIIHKHWVRCTAFMRIMHSIVRTFNQRNFQQSVRFFLFANCLIYIRHFVYEQSCAVSLFAFEFLRLACLLIMYQKWLANERVHGNKNSTAKYSITKIPWTDSRTNILRMTELNFAYFRLFDQPKMIFLNATVNLLFAVEFINLVIHVSPFQSHQIVYLLDVSFAYGLTLWKNTSVRTHSHWCIKLRWTLLFYDFFFF